ncbi:hypothetical protein SLEP1_g53784 [Rubroshorea leprosula]|uniref:Uncharacterized protein n=1 Tax=Rubroshorea leprosula TaxID=152421 RepID=A0AAV5MAD8_9ROSI|nr:hypothetical protein SLEP1_g53784 [Rubroshorea leprosula]
MLDPANDLLRPPSSPTISSVSSSDLDTESTGSFFRDRSTTLGTLMGVSFPAITFGTPSQNRGGNATTTVSVGRTKPKKRGLAAVAFGGERRLHRRWKWWRLCRDGDAKPASLGEFLEVERRFGDVAFYDDAAELEGVMGSHHHQHQHQQQLQEQHSNGRVLFADGRVLPPAVDDEETSTAGVLCRFPVLLTGICSGGAG